MIKHKSSLKKKSREVFLTAKQLAVDNEPSEAIRVIDEYLSRYDSEDVDVLLLKGSILEMLLEHDQAAKLYKKVLHIDKDNPRALIDLGDCYYTTDCKSGYRKAIQCYNRALKLIESGRFYWDEQDEFIGAVGGKAKALLDLNRPMEALRCIVHGLQKYPSNILLASFLQTAQERYEAYEEEKSEEKKKRKGLRVINNLPPRK